MNPLKIDRFFIHYILLTDDNCSFRLLALEARCPESLEFYGSYDPYELSKHPISLYSMYKRWARLKESNTTLSCYSTTDMKTLMPGPTDLSEMGLNLIRLQVILQMQINLENASEFFCGIEKKMFDFLNSTHTTSP